MRLYIHLEPTVTYTYVYYLDIHSSKLNPPTITGKEQWQNLQKHAETIWIESSRGNVECLVDNTREQISLRPGTFTKIKELAEPRQDLFQIKTVFQAEYVEPLLTTLTHKQLWADAVLEFKQTKQYQMLKGAVFKTKHWQHPTMLWHHYSLEVISLPQSVKFWLEINDYTVNDQLTATNSHCLTTWLDSHLSRDWDLE